MSPVPTAAVAAPNTAAIIDGAARVMSDAIDGHIYAAGVTQSVTDLVPQVVPLADDISEGDFPAVTVAMGEWSPILQPGNLRLGLTLVCAIWTRRVPLAENARLLYECRDRLETAWIAHSKAYMTEASIQSAVLMGGPGIVPVNLPTAARPFLTLPFTIEIKCNHDVSPQPA